MNAIFNKKNSSSLLTTGLLLGTLSQVANGLTVGVLGNHNAEAWGTNCTESDLSFTQCNLGLYAETAKVGAQNQVDFLVFPEGYSLARLYNGAVYEPLISQPGNVPCDVAGSAESIQQQKLSCLAKQYEITIAANVFVTLVDGTTHISEVVYDQTGSTLAVYHKHHLFPNEILAGMSAGPYAPTTFSAFNRKWGIIICYEGVYPFDSGDFAQMDDLKALGASGFVWSIGSEVPVNSLAGSLAGSYDVDVITSMGHGVTPSNGVIVDSVGDQYNYTDFKLAVSGYTGKAILRTSVISNSETA